MKKQQSSHHPWPLLGIIILPLLFSACSIEKHPTKSIRPPADITQKKQQFFDRIRPAALEENRQLEEAHMRIVKLNRDRLHGRHLSDRDRAWLLATAREYGISSPSLERPETWQQLLERVDVIPLELVLAQAANESAWGTSRFAREGNNYFGQWCFRKGCGLVPKHRNAGASHEVARYASVRESVKSYMHNLNSSPAYAQLRKIRAHARKHQRKINALELAEGLSQYSERGRAYVRSLQKLIRSNARIMRQTSQADHA